MRISENVYISSPEFLFLQKAGIGSFSFEKLILLGYGICGRFAYSSNPEEKMDIIQVSERSNINRIMKFLDDVERINAPAGKKPYGLRRARRAMSNVLGSVESPPEARITMLEFLKPSLGGNSVIPPECNGVVKLSPELMEATGRKHFRCDFLWRNQKVVLEYNGAQHGNPRDVARDAEKYNALRAGGYEVILAAREHISSQQCTDALAKQLRFVLGQRAPHVRYDHDARKSHLRKEIGVY